MRAPGGQELLDVLVVDDEPGILRAVERTLAGSPGCSDLCVGTTTDPLQALALLEQRTVRLLITDFRMPVLNGCEVLNRARHIAPATMRMLLTGQADMDDLVEAVNAGSIYRYMAKPWDNEELARAVQDALAEWDAHERRRHAYETADLERRNLLSAVEIVSDIQRALLPAGAVEIVGADAAFSFTHCEHATGDYVDAIQLGGGRTAVIIGDVCGHGLGAALFVFTARALLRSGLREGQDLARVVARTNRFLCEDMAVGRFLTLFAGIHDPVRECIDYVNAGHHAALVLGGDEAPLARTSLPLGVMADADYGVVRTAHLRAGETLFAYTDGVVEARSPDAELFGSERLDAVIREWHDAPPRDLLAAVRDAVGEFTNGAGCAQDDIAMLAYRPLAAGVRSPRGRAQSKSPRPNSNEGRPATLQTSATARIETSRLERP